MALWGRNDEAMNAPSNQIIAGSSANGYVMFANTTANSFIINHTSDGVNPAQSNVAIGVFGVDVAETQVGSNSTFSLPPHAGWATRTTYTDMHGNSRVKHEVLVAMSSIANDATGFTTSANTTGSLDDPQYPDS
tara:strand:+ start:1225 stop:1626 length:402 start_codon:yes stop_codon:yes gene_type:complete